MRWSNTQVPNSAELTELPWLVSCFAVSVLCGLFASCIPSGDTPPPSSSPADLAALELSVGRLQPIFASPTTHYTVFAPNSATTTMITATTVEPAAKLTIDNQPAISGQPFGPIALGSATTPISVVVEPPNNQPAKSYTILVSPAGNASLQSLTVTPGTLAPSFQPSTLTYSVAVPTGGSITMTAVTQDATSVLRVNGGIVASGTAVAVPILQAGENRISVTVTAAAGAQQEYVVIVTPASADTALASARVVASIGGETRDLLICPSLTTVQKSYSVTPVPNTTTVVTVSAQTASPLATLRINGQQVVSGVPITVALSTGNTTIDLDVTAQAGNTQRYRLTANRATSNSSNDSLWKLTLSGGELSPPFCHDELSYTVVTAQSETMVTATAADPKATIQINGVDAISGQAFGPIALTKAKTTIRIEVRAQSGSSMVYTVTVLKP